MVSDEADLTDMYYSGSYKVYRGVQAIQEFEEAFPEYSAFEDTLDITVESDEIEAVYLIILESEEPMVNNKNQFKEGQVMVTPYLGTLNYDVNHEVKLKMYNMRTRNELIISVKEEYKDELINIRFIKEE